MNYLCLANSYIHKHFSRPNDIVKFVDSFKPPASFVRIDGLPADISRPQPVASNDESMALHRYAPGEERLPGQLKWLSPKTGHWILFRDEHRFFLLEREAKKFKYLELSGAEARLKFDGASRRIARICPPIRAAAGVMEVVKKA